MSPQTSYSTSCIDPVTDFATMRGEQSLPTRDDPENASEKAALPWGWGFCAKCCGETFVRERVLHKGLGPFLVFAIIICAIGCVVLASDENRMQYIIGLSVAAGAIVGLFGAARTTISLDDKIMDANIDDKLVKIEKSLTHMQSDEYVANQADRFQSVMLSDEYATNLANHLARELNRGGDVAEAAGGSPEAV